MATGAVYRAYVRTLLCDLRWDDVAKLYDLSKQGPLPDWNFQPSYNVCPTVPVPVIIPSFFDEREALGTHTAVLSKPLKDPAVPAAPAKRKARYFTTYDLVPDG